MPTPKKILIISPSWIGDIIIAQALFKYLKSQYPFDITIDILAPQWSHELIALMPEINKIWDMPIGHTQLQLKKRWQIGKLLRLKKYHQAIILPNSWKAALIPFAAHIPQRTGWLGELRFGLLNDWRVLKNEKLPLLVQRYLALGTKEYKNINWSDYRPHLEISPFKNFFLDPPIYLSGKAPILALCPGAAYGAAKRWPIEYFSEVALHQANKGWKILLLGSKEDKDIGQKIQNLTHHTCINLIGQTSLLQATYLLSRANIVISNDSGLMHIASALERPLIALYGSSSPQFTPPLSRFSKIISLNLDCSPCFQRNCPLFHLNCLKQLKPDSVLLAIKDINNHY